MHESEADGRLIHKAAGVLVGATRLMTFASQLPERSKHRRELEKLADGLKDEAVRLREQHDALVKHFSSKQPRVNLTAAQPSCLVPPYPQTGYVGASTYTIDGKKCVD